MLQRLNTTSMLALAGLLLGLWIAPATAQSNDEPPPACPAPEARQFDFWIGDWDIYVGSQKGAENLITREMNGCMIRERYSSV